MSLMRLEFIRARNRALAVFDPIKDRPHPVIIFMGNGVAFVRMAAGTVDGQAEKRLADDPE
mgnify:CR=1 FL=1